MATVAQEKSEALKKAEEEAAIAKAKELTLASELAIAKSQQDINNLSSELKKKQAETEKAVAELNKANIETNKANVLAGRDLFKGPEITAPTGNITTSDGAFIESRVLAQLNLKKCMTDMCTSLKSGLGTATELVIYSAPEYKGLELHASLLAQLKQMRSDFEMLNRNVKSKVEHDFDPNASDLADPLLLGYAAAGILRTAADLASLFKVTTDYKNFDITQDENMITSAFTAAAKTAIPNVKVFNPAVFPINTVKASSQQSEVIKEMTLLSKGTAEADQNLKLISQRSQKWTPLAEKETVVAKKAKINKYLADLVLMSGQLGTMKELTSKLTIALSTADANSATTPLSVLLGAERLALKLQQTGVYTIKLVSTSKGSNRIKQGLWSSARISFTSGTELSTVVYGVDGDIAFADNRTEYSDYMDPSEVKAFKARN